MLELALRPASSAQAQDPPTARQRREAGSEGHWLRLRGRCTTPRAVVPRLAVALPPRLIARRV
jgi:hypothetical protein